MARHKLVTRGGWLVVCGLSLAATADSAAEDCDQRVYELTLELVELESVEGGTGGASGEPALEQERSRIAEATVRGAYKSDGIETISWQVNGTSAYFEKSPL